MKKTDKIFQIILAGGRSSRMGRPKGLIEIDGRSIIISHIQNFASATDGMSIAVVGHYTDEYLEKIRGASNVIPIENSNYDLGQFSSILIGLKKAYELGATHAFIMPVDVAPCAPNTYKRLLSHINDNLVVKPKVKSVSGHPILISRTVIERLLKVNPSEEMARLDRQLHLVPLHKTTWVEVADINITKNLNTPDDLL